MGRYVDGLGVHMAEFVRPPVPSRRSRKRAVGQVLAFAAVVLLTESGEATHAWAAGSSTAGAPTPSAEPSQPIPYSSLPGAIPAAPTPTPSAPAVELPAGPTDAQVAAIGRGRFIWPTLGSLLARFWPWRGVQRNDGVDIAAPDGAPVRAAAAGEVVYAGNQVPDFGNLVLIKHRDGWVTAYAHLSNTEVKIRDHVAQGAEIGTVGTSGGVTQPQLHFEVRYAASPRERARPIDPALVLPAGQ